MRKPCAILLLLPALLFGQFKADSAGAPPAETASINAMLIKDGIKVLKADGSVVCEIWMRSDEPTGGKAEENASFTTIPVGALLGVIRFPARFNDRRGQTIKPGVYTMRYGLFPVNGDHQGVAPQRDFLVLSPAAVDTNATTTLSFDALMDSSRKASGTPHPLVMSFWKADAGTKPGLDNGEHDSVLTTKLGQTAISIIVVGKAEG
jgi:hypothetical protein